MSARTTSREGRRIVLVAPGPKAELAADLLVAHLGMDPQEAARRLANGPGTLAEAVPAPAAARLLPLLRLFGLRVCLEDAGAPPTEPRFDLALQLRPHVRAAQAAPRLADVLHRAPDEVAADLEGPEGLVLRALDWDAASLWRRALPRLPGLRMVISDPETARYDLLSWTQPADPLAAPALTMALARLGVGRCRLTGAVAADVDRVMRDHVLARFPGAGLRALNRDFQRFDLVLRDTGGTVPPDLAGFLALRRGGGRPAGATRTAALRLPDAVIERGLARAQAMAFRAEYAAIGLAAGLRLSGLPGNGSGS